MDRRSLLEIVEQGYSYHIIRNFAKKDIFSHFKDPVLPSHVAETFGYNKEVFETIIVYLYQTTDLFLCVSRDGDNYYQINTLYDDYFKFGHYIEKYFFAYDPCFRKLEETLKNQEIGRELVNDVHFSNAFNFYSYSPNFNAFIANYGTNLLDLGCGTAGICCSFAIADKNHRAWGIDISPNMVEKAEERIKQLGLSNVNIFLGNVREINNVLPEDVINSVDIIFGNSIVNEFFMEEEGAINFLKHVKELFPTQYFIVSDYYGKLGKVDEVSNEFRHTMIHDLVQVVTGQGVPYENQSKWEEIYNKAGYKLVKQELYISKGIENFTHIIRPTKKK